MQEKMTNAQKEELDNIRRIGFLERQRATAIKQAREEADKLSRAEREQKAINDSIMSDLRKIHQLRQDIYKLESKRTPTDDDRIKLTLLREQQQVAKQAMETAMKHYQREGLVTQELKQQMQAQRDINQTEMKRIQRASQLQNEQEQTNAKLKKYMDLTRQIGQLQRDLIYSGMRERNVIEDKVNQLESQRSQLRDNLRQQNLLTDAVEREVKAIERAQREQRVLNRERQKARERDQAFNDTGGLIDPYSFMANVEQGAMHILEPIARLDEALIGVMKVADATEEQFREFAESSYDVGSSLGVAADEYVLAVEKWVTAGKTFKESQELANISLVGSFVGNISPDDMVKYMAVPLNAFKKDMLEAEDVINSMNEVSNNHAIEMNDLGKAYVRSATTAKDAGISFGELTGMITGAQEATRKGGERIGTGLKTIAMNMGNINAQMTKGERRKFDFFQSIGVDFQNAEGKMLTGTEILQNLVNVYDELSTEDKTTAKFYLAGKEHAEILGAVVDQWDRVKTVNGEVGAQLGEGKEGSAYLEHAKQADSVKFKLAELKNTWDKFMWTIAGGKDGVSDVLGTITEGLEALTDLASNESLMKAIKYIFAGMALHAGANLYKRFFDTFMTGIGRMKRGMNETRGLMKEMRTGQSLAMGGVGATSVIARTGIGNRGGNGSNGGNGGNGTHANGTRIVPLVGGVGGVGNRSRQEEQEARRRQQLRDREDRSDEERTTRAEKRADRVNVRMSATAKTFTKFLGALPLL
ncbi:phage tail tape measure protein, partial [Bacillus pumilus]|uniref:phage tail tape measure protein n=1 Tax=Bacillus pumilus TaxID=1408 RepID=UPI00119CB6A2